MLSLAITLGAGIAWPAEIPQIVQLAEAEFQQVDFRMDAQGVLTIAGSTSEQIELPVVVNSKQSFIEKRFESEQPLHCVRYYESARASMRIGKGSQTVSLNQTQPYIINNETRDASRGSFQIHSATGELSGAQIDLLRTPANFLVINRFLRQATKVDESLWQPTDRDLALLLNVDTVTSNQVRLKNAVSISDRGSSQKTEISLSGSVSGMAAGAETEIRLKGKFHIDETTHLVSQVDLDIRESRKAGPAAPSFEITAVLQMKIKTLPTSPQLSDETIAKLDFRDKISNQAVFSSPQNGFELLHDQRWRVISERPGKVVLRMIDAGEMLSQCEIVAAANLPKGKFETLADFQEQIRKSGGEQILRIVEASESAGLDGTQVIRVVATGILGDSPMNFMLYQLTNLDGRRISLLFSCEPSLAKQFNDADLRLAEEFRFTRQPDSLTGETKSVAEKPASNDQ